MTNSWLRSPPIGPVLGPHRNGGQAEPREGAQIGGEHLVVGMTRARLIEIEGIGVLHQEFARAHHAEARPHLVAELPLDVIEIERQILVGAHGGAEDLSDHFLVGRPVQHVAIVPVLDAQHFLAVIVVASRIPARDPPTGWSASGVRSRRRGSAPRGRWRRSCAAPGRRAAARRRSPPPPAGSCRRAASADARRFPPLSASPSGSAGSSGKDAWKRALRTRIGRERYASRRSGLMAAKVGRSKPRNLSCARCRTGHG